MSLPVALSEGVALRPRFKKYNDNSTCHLSCWTSGLLQEGKLASKSKSSFKYQIFCWVGLPFFGSSCCGERRLVSPPLAVSTVPSLLCERPMGSTGKPAARRQVIRSVTRTFPVRAFKIILKTPKRLRTPYKMFFFLHIYWKNKNFINLHQHSVCQ